jgi:pimeloyl-ACP methyl ester carboxylesterase
VLRAHAGFLVSAWGEGPPRVVALHGWRRSHSDFDALGGLLGSAIPGIAPDLPGFGSAPPPSAPWGSREYAEALAVLLEEAAVVRGPLVVVGHSLGGRIAVRLAASRPELVAGLVLAAAPLVRLGQPRKVPFVYRAARAASRRHLVPGSVLEAARRRWGSSDYLASTGIMRDVLVRIVNESYEDDLQKISAPVELVWGDGDREVPIEVARRLEELLAQAKLTILSGVGHMVPLEAPSALAEAVERLVP